MSNAQTVSFSNGTLGQVIAVDFHEDDLHIRNGMRLVLTATRTEVANFLALLDSWAFRPPADRIIAEYGDGTSGESQPQTESEKVQSAAEPLTDEQSAKLARIQTAVGLLLDELIVGPEIPLMAFAKVLDSVDRDKAMQVAEKLQAQLPPQVRDIFAILQTL